MQEEIFNNYYDKLYSYALSKTRSKDDALDLVNDIFLAIYSYLNKGLKIEKLDNLIWKIASNCWKKKAAKYIKEKNIIHDDLVLENISTTCDEIEKIIYQDIMNNLKEFNLTEKEELCFNAYYKEDLSIKEISNRYHIDTNNIKYYLYNSRKKIKERYDD